MDTDILLSMTGIDKRFAGIPALSAASFTVARGEVHALIGQNGAGKSTLIKVLTGYHRRDAGDVTFDGKPFEVASPQQAQANGISTIYQEINLVPYRSLTENICLGREKRRFGLLDWASMHREAENLLQRFNIRVNVRRPLMEFNTATQQMVAIARAIGFSAKLVIMDEPTSSLDEREVGVLFNVIRQLKQDGVSVVFVSHKLDELYAVCDRVTIMRDGRTIRTARMDGIEKIELVSSMLGRSIEKTEGHATAFTARDEKNIGKVLLSADNLAVGQIVQDVSFTIRSGEIAGFAGLLGAGRTETARLVFGIDRLKAGAMTYGDKTFEPRRPSDAIAAGMGFCTEDRKSEGIVPDMSVAENMMLALMPKLAKSGVIDEKAQQEIVKRFIKQLGIKCSGPDQKVRELSGGNQQKVLLGRWLAMNPRLLILDEPTRGIDVGAKAEIHRLVSELAKQGVAVIMISSEMPEVLGMSDRIMVMHEGRVTGFLDREEATQVKVMELASK